MKRSELGWALLLSVPVGVGVMLAVLQTVGGSPTDPLALGGGLLATVSIFVLVVLGVRTNPDEPIDGPTGEKR